MHKNVNSFACIFSVIGTSDNLHNSYNYTIHIFFGLYLYTCIMYVIYTFVIG